MDNSDLFTFHPLIQQFDPPRGVDWSTCRPRGDAQPSTGLSPSVGGGSPLEHRQRPSARAVTRSRRLRNNALEWRHAIGCLPRVANSEPGPRSPERCGPGNLPGQRDQQQGLPGQVLSERIVQHLPMPTRLSSGVGPSDLEPGFLKRCADAKVSRGCAVLIRGHGTVCECQLGDQVEPPGAEAESVCRAVGESKTVRRSATTGNCFFNGGCRAARRCAPARTAS